MDEHELFPAPTVARTYMVHLRPNGTYEVTANHRREGGPFGEPRQYNSLSLSEVCDVICAELYRFE